MLLQQIAQLIAPHSCLACQEEGALICQSCRDQAVVVKAATCYRCNRLSEGGKTCASCRSSSALSGVIVASHYDGTIKELIQYLKYYRARAAAEILAEYLAERIEPGKFDVITCVPVATNHYRQRGYNQAELIAKSLSRKLDLPYQKLLMRNRNVQQVGHSRAERLRQAQGVFRSNNHSPVRVLLVDDVLTTGATLGACAAELKKAGAKTVWGAVAAKH